MMFASLRRSPYKKYLIWLGGAVLVLVVVVLVLVLAVAILVLVLVVVVVAAMLWCRLSRCSAVTARWHLRIDPCRCLPRRPVRVFSCIVDTELPGCSVISQRRFFHEALQCLL